MRVRSVMIIGGQAVIKGPASRADALNNTLIDQQIKNTINGNTIDRTAPFQDFIDITCGKGKSIIADNFQNAHPIGRRIDIGS